MYLEDKVEKGEIKRLVEDYCNSKWVGGISRGVFRICYFLCGGGRGLWGKVKDLEVLLEFCKSDWLIMMFLIRIENVKEKVGLGGKTMS